MAKMTEGFKDYAKRTLEALHAQPVIAYKECEFVDSKKYKWCITDMINHHRVYLFFNEVEHVWVIDLEDTYYSGRFFPEKLREIVIDEQTKPTHEKDSRQGLQGSGFFGLLGHYASYIRQLLRKRKAAR